MEVILVIIAAAIAWYLYKKLSPNTMTIQFKVYASRAEAMKDGHPLSSGGRFDQEVVGESHYQSIIAKIVASMPAGHNYVQSTLEMESNNPHDSNAVAVKIAGQLVGYLPKAAAKEYRKLAKSEGIPAIAHCPATIRGSADTAYGIWLGLPELE